MELQIQTTANGAYFLRVYPSGNSGAELEKLIALFEARAQLPVYRPLPPGLYLPVTQGKLGRAGFESIIRRGLPPRIMCSLETVISGNEAHLCLGSPWFRELAEFCLEFDDSPRDPQPGRESIPRSSFAGLLYLCTVSAADLPWEPAPTPGLAPDFRIDLLRTRRFVEAELPWYRNLAWEVLHTRRLYKG